MKERCGMNDAIRLFVTGGTFDKEYNERNGTLYFKDTHLSDMLKLGRCLLEIEVRTLMMIDSLDMDDEDRTMILSQCRKSEHQRIVITHGTDTMETTARLLGEHISEENMVGKTIVLTGAMIPYAFGSSDGLFNLGSSLAFAQALLPGVYVAMNGRCFQWDNVRKNRDVGVFEELD
ncbi:MAG: L-asparaginase [Candidatus Krumholzibacteriia bacterium]|jgi:L-asparaginase